MSEAKKKQKKAVGQQGSWFATVDGERLPCVHQHWVHSDNGTLHYCDPIPNRETNPKYPDYFKEIESCGMVILTKDKVPEWQRLGYIAVFRIDNFRLDETGLNFDLIERVCNLQG